MNPCRAALQAWGAQDQDDPFPLLHRIRDLGPVHRTTLADGHEAWLVVSYDEARAALNDPRLSKDMHAALAASGAVVAEGLPGPAFARHMLAVDPPDHTRLRGLVSKAFSRGRVDGLRPRVQKLIDDLLDDVAAADSPVDLVARFAFPLPFTVICELLGVDEDDRAPLGAALRILLAPAPTPEAYARAEAASDEVVRLLRKLVAGKRECRGDDLVSDLIDARDGADRLTEQELLSTIFQLIVAGHDTTASLLGNAMVALLSRPGQLAALRADPTGIPGAVEELLRFDAPVPHATFRYATEPVELGGERIPEGAQVLICLAAANRDPRRFPDPDLLDPAREQHHIAFGHGIHFCLGARLARMEGGLGLSSLLHRFPRMRLAVEPGELHWDHGDGLVLRGLSQLPVVPGPSASDG